MPCGARRSAFAWHSAFPGPWERGCSRFLGLVKDTDARAVGIAGRFWDFEKDVPDTRMNDGRTDREGRFVVGGYNEKHRVNNEESSGVYRMGVDGKVRYSSARWLGSILHRCGGLMESGKGGGGCIGPSRAQQEMLACPHRTRRSPPAARARGS